jgi:hypothetical protein
MDISASAWAFMGVMVALPIFLLIVETHERRSK